ncbi:universal stress protein [Kordia sp.]|uniref:universal stress protein n=1 Tax=Kordia sp. TaxID=1965332 RepID=UPI0025BF29FE|nr:universal stress protein [Kordia sp.]MCH2195498.1 universal stress protein [Kordia sp.]
MKIILLPTGFSENSWNAIVHTLEFLKNTMCNFYVLHVADEAAKAESKMQFQELHARISLTFPNNQNHHFYTLIHHNSFTEAVRVQAEDKKIDMIIMGAKGITGEQSNVMGHYAANAIKK